MNTYYLLVSYTENLVDTGNHEKDLGLGRLKLKYAPNNEGTMVF